MGLFGLNKRNAYIKSSFTIDGMHCGMCESHVCDVIRKNISVKKVSASHIKKELIIYAETEIQKEEVEKVLAPTGYKVI